jgi:hypothetical protein
VPFAPVFESLAITLTLIAVPAYAQSSADLRKYQFELYAGGGWESYYNSLRMAL